jgi:antitoxin component YwqK of YwqJK toxin-antitoxin module
LKQVLKTSSQTDLKTNFVLQQGQGEHRFPSGHYDIAMWDQGLRHGPAVYYHPNGGKEECTYVEGYENGPSTVYFAK